MFDSNKNKIPIALSILILMVSACGSTPESQENISTAVAQTVQAQNSLTKIANSPTLTSTPPAVVTADTAATNTSALVIGAPACTISSSLAGENPPDGTLLRPGEYFWKTWSLENTGTCTWDPTYKLVYRSGDLMGGLISYPLPEAIAPGETKDITIYLKAPETEGSATGYWSIQTPWNTYFGVGSDPIYVQVSVSNARRPDYGITSVTYTITRNPESGCPANVLYTVYATITTNGPYEFDYFWNQKDGNESGIRNMKFTAAGSQILSREWMVGRGDSPNPRWMQIIVTDPDYMEYAKAVFENNCP